MYGTNRAKRRTRAHRKRRLHDPLARRRFCIFISEIIGQARPPKRKYDIRTEDDRLLLLPGQQRLYSTHTHTATPRDTRPAAQQLRTTKHAHA